MTSKLARDTMPSSPTSQMSTSSAGDGSTRWPEGLMPKARARVMEASPGSRGTAQESFPVGLRATTR
eukprot:7309831-Heterocapsa_arctica.AAC.1